MIAENNNYDYNSREAKKREILEMYGKYRGMRALLLTRVSTGSQSHEAQERVIREFLIDLLNLQLDEERHVIHDTYTGLEYRYREALDEILRMAERREFDVLCLDVLDRGLGRKGVSREIFRGQLRELGIHVLTTEKSDHSDDDSLEGQLMRLLKGYKAEEEVNDFVRRVKNAKRDKALGNPAKNIPPKVIGYGGRPYGYKYVRDAQGKVETLEPNHDIVWVDSKGIAWSEVRVMVFVFRCLKRRIALRSICMRLNKIGIPAPCTSTGRKYTSRGIVSEKLEWLHSTLSKIVRRTVYSGRYTVNRYRSVSVPGKKAKQLIENPPEEWIIVPVPAIVSVELQEEALRYLGPNQQFSRRNNKQEEPGLLYGGLAKCGNCGRTARSVNHLRTYGKREYIYYECSRKSVLGLQKCSGCFTSGTIVDNAVWDAVLKVIQDPTIVDKKLKEKRSKDPTEGRRRQIKKKLDELQDEREALQETLIRLIKERKLDKKTEDALTARLREIERIERQYNSEKIDEDKMRREWEAAQKELEKLHRKCANMREKLKDSSYKPTLKEKRGMIEFLGITAIVWKEGHINPQTGKPERVRVQGRFNDIVVQLS